MRRIALALLAALLLLAGCDRGAGIVTVPEPTAPSEVLTGVYQARIPAETFTGEFDFLPEESAGRWTLTFDGEDFILEATNFRVTEQYYLLDGEFTARGTPAPEGAYNCFHEGGRRLLGEGEAVGLYRLAQSADSLRFNATNDRCPVRELFLERRWRKIADEAPAGSATPVEGATPAPEDTSSPPGPTPSPND
jgi:hypothetical protein